MGAIWNPVNPFQFIKCRDALEGFVSDMEYTIFFDILREEKLDSLDGRKCLFNDGP